MARKALIFVTVIFSILITAQGCVKEKEKPAEPSTIQNVNEVEQGISDVGNVDEELNISDLEGLEQELNDVNW